MSTELCFRYRVDREGGRGGANKSSYSFTFSPLSGPELGTRDNCCDNLTPCNTKKLIVDYRMSQKLNKVSVDAWGNVYKLARAQLALFRTQSRYSTGGILRWHLAVAPLRSLGGLSAALMHGKLQECPPSPPPELCSWIPPQRFFTGKQCMWDSVKRAVHK